MLHELQLIISVLRVFCEAYNTLWTWGFEAPNSHHLNIFGLCRKQKHTPSTSSDVSGHPGFFLLILSVFPKQFYHHLKDVSSGGSAHIHT